MKRFTLIELIVVVAIFGILISILLPSLRKARYHSKLAVCVSNLKQTGISYTLYATNNNRRYPAYEHYWFGKTLYYKRKASHIGVKNNINGGAFESHIKQYWGLDPNENGEAVRNAFTCPLVQNEYGKLHRKTNNDGSTYVKFPYKYTNNLAMAYYTYNSFKPSGTQKMMEFLGEPFIIRKGSDNLESHILGSDVVMGYPSLNGIPRDIVNHYPVSNGNTLDYSTVTERNGAKIPGFIDKANAVGNGWLQMGTSYSANYLMDDGSAKIKKGLNKHNTYEFGGFSLTKDLIDE
jgi:prepilin-type N-terminal cleavage/methylation domain-containing protein